jgi:hypothetical protein
MFNTASVKEWLFRSNWMVPLVRSIASAVYLGPWRRPVIGLMAKIHHSRTVDTNSDSAIVEIDREACSQRLLRTGYSGTFRFSRELIDQVLAEIPPDFSGREFNLHRNSPAIRKIMYDPQVISLVTEYLGVAPHVYQTELTAYNRMERSQLEPGEKCTKKFHYDVSDFSSVTLFVYLNDIETDGGAHVVIPSTNRSLSLAKLGSRFLSYTDACNRYGEGRMVKITGAKGTAFLEDLVNWHKRSLTNRGRYCLAVTYNLNRTN